MMWRTPKKLNNGERLFYYVLAEKLGYASINIMLDEMTSKDVTEWQAFYEIKEDERKKEEAKG